MTDRQKYLTKEVTQLTGVSQYRLYQMRKGYTLKYKSKLYKYDPILIEHEDFDYIGNIVIYYAEAISKINQFSNG